MTSGNRRARDIDRSLTCTALDRAYAEGQLDFDEHRTRVASAMRAKTLGQLRALTGDLQSDDPLPEPRPRLPQVPRLRSGAWLAIAIVGAVVLVNAGIAGWLWARESRSLLTNSALHAMVEDLQAKFGDTRFDEVSIFEEHAVLERSMAGSPDRSVSYTYRRSLLGGRINEWTRDKRAPGQPVFDLREVDIDRVLVLLEDAPRLLKVDSPDNRHVRLGSTTSKPQQVSIYLSNEYRESGSLEAGFDGRNVTADRHGQ